MLKLWGRASSLNVQKVIWTLGELDVPYQRVDVGGRFGGLDSPSYRALNPNQRIPTLEDGEVVVWESNAVVRYVAARYGAGVLWDPDPGRRAKADQWMDWMQTTLMPDFFALFWAVVRTAPAKQDPRDFPRLTAALVQRYRLIEAQLAGNRFLLGEALSIADIAVGATLYRYYEMEIERPRLDRLRAWYDRLGERPAYRNSVMTSFEELRGR